MRVLFLDIDGVLNSEEWFDSSPAGDREWPDDHIDPQAVCHLNEIVQRSGCAVVLSSAWRNLIGLDGLVALLRTKGYVGPDILDRTPRSRFGFRPRGLEIQEWLDSTVEDMTHHVQGFAIVDDGSDMEHLRPWLVQTDFEQGLRPCHIEPILRLLGTDVSTGDKEKKG